MALERGEEHLQDTIIGTEEALAKLYMEMLDPKGDKLKTLTDVTPSEVFSLPVLFVIGKAFNSKMMEDYANDFLRLRISRVRSSRQEFVFIGSGLGGMNQDKRGRGLGDLFSGLTSK